MLKSGVLCGLCALLWLSVRGPGCGVGVLARGVSCRFLWGGPCVCVVQCALSVWRPAAGAGRGLGEGHAVDVRPADCCELCASRAIHVHVHVVVVHVMLCYVMREQRAERVREPSRTRAPFSGQSLSLRYFTLDALRGRRIQSRVGSRRHGGRGRPLRLSLTNVHIIRNGVSPTAKKRELRGLRCCTHGRVTTSDKSVTL
jgi:hypothetical protein